MKRERSLLTKIVCFVFGFELFPEFIQKPFAPKRENLSSPTVFFGQMLIYETDGTNDIFLLALFFGPMLIYLIILFGIIIFLFSVVLYFGPM